MTPANDTDRWPEDRTTFQRVYDVLVGTTTFLTAAEFAERADCSANGARHALEQLAEMGIASRQDARPVRYRRNDSYFTWRRVESLAHEYTTEELRERIAGLIQDDEAFQEAYGVPEPDAVSTDDLPVDDHEALHERWDDLQEWRTVRRDIRVLRRAVQQAESPVDDAARA
jgi:predicted transcriptional regulator